ncbi:hypothetical protein BV133_347 [Blastochloris viridis]|uniref:Uncharacterized protein n=1 Tax=Blastochloris viridis TaxID=1079 RepID=A0A182CXM0_BLAVI|nr:hypothetical protein BV133_347 [Blastochloris viridis]
MTDLEVQTHRLLPHAQPKVRKASPAATAGGTQQAVWLCASGSFRLSGWE